MNVLPSWLVVLILVVLALNVVTLVWLLFRLRKVADQFQVDSGSSMRDSVNSIQKVGEQTLSSAQAVQDSVARSIQQAEQDRAKLRELLIILSRLTEGSAEVVMTLRRIEEAAAGVASNLALAQAKVEGVADDLARSHERADAVTTGDHGAAADAASRLTVREQEMLEAESESAL